MHQQEPELRACNSLPVSISLARLKLSTIAKITFKDVTNKYFKFCTSQQKMDKNNEYENSKNSGQQGPQNTNNKDFIQKSKMTSGVPSERRIPNIRENDVIIIDDNVSEQNRGSPAKTKVTIKNNLPVYIPPFQSDEIVKKDAETQTAKIYFLTKEGYERIQKLYSDEPTNRSKPSQKDCFTQTATVANDDINNNTEMGGSNNEIVNDLVTQSDRNKALLGQFYKFPYTLGSIRAPEQINVTAVVEQVIYSIQDRFKARGTKLYVDGSTQTRITNSDVALFSPVSEDEATSTAPAQAQFERLVPDATFTGRTPLAPQPPPPPPATRTDVAEPPQQISSQYPYHTASQPISIPDPNNLMINALQVREQQQQFGNMWPASTAAKVASASSPQLVASPYFADQQRAVGNQVSPMSSSFVSRWGQQATQSVAMVGGGVGARRGRKPKVSPPVFRFSSTPYQRSQDLQPQYAQTQQQMHDSNVQQRQWGQLSNYPNSDWTQNVQAQSYRRTQ